MRDQANGRIEALRERMAHLVSAHQKPRGKSNPSIIRANLSGTDTCTAVGIFARGSTPILALCRSLIAAGMDSDWALEVCRGAALTRRACLIRFPALPLFDTGRLKASCTDSRAAWHL